MDDIENDIKAETDKKEHEENKNSGKFDTMMTQNTLEQTKQGLV